MLVSSEICKRSHLIATIIQSLDKASTAKRFRAIRDESLLSREARGERHHLLFALSLQLYASRRHLVLADGVGRDPSCDLSYTRRGNSLSFYLTDQT
jgi:hypothetical protein